LAGTNEASFSLTICDTVSCQPVGPGTPITSGCSTLIFPVYTSSATDPNLSNTLISITNTDVNRSVALHLFIVDGATCSVADNYLCLTKSQTASFTMADLDPGTTGYLMVVAVNPRTGCPIISIT
jgi:hypothetical protein